MNKKSLIVVDLQNDFVSGSLAIPKAEEIIPIIKWIDINKEYAITIITQDWHPENHISFKQWPVHCVQDSYGAMYIQGGYSNLNKSYYNIKKGTDKDVDSYSAFFDNEKKHATNLQKYLATYEISEIDIVGLATDYCVKYTALDAAQLGYDTTVLSFACRGTSEENSSKAILEMKNNGITII